MGEARQERETNLCEFRPSRWSLQGALQWKSPLRIAFLLPYPQARELGSHSLLTDLRCPGHVEVNWATYLPSACL